MRDRVDEALLLAAHIEDPTGKHVVYVPARRDERERREPTKQDGPAK